MATPELRLPEVDLDWPAALRHLQRVVASRRTYLKNGKPHFDAALTILEVRVSQNERTPRLWAAIMNLRLE